MGKFWKVVKSIHIITSLWDIQYQKTNKIKTNISDLAIVVLLETSKIYIKAIQKLNIYIEHKNLLFFITIKLLNQW